MPDSLSYSEADDVGDWQDYSIEGATEVFLLRKRITDLEAQLAEANERADVYEFSRLGPIQESRDEWKSRAEKAERQRDDLAAALRAIQSDAPISDIPSDNYWKQIADKMGDIAALALGRLEDEKGKT